MSNDSRSPEDQLADFIHRGRRAQAVDQQLEHVSDTLDELLELVRSDMGPRVGLQVFADMVRAHIEGIMLRARKRATGPGCSSCNHLAVLEQLLGQFVAKGGAR